VAGGDRQGLIARRAARLLAAGACALWLAGCGKQGPPVVKIGFVAPLTGDQAPHGQDMLNGAVLALEEAQRQGEIIPGYRVELVPLDDQRNPTQAVSAAKKLVADPDVVAVIGHLNSSCTMPASAIYHEAQVLQISPVSSNPQISRQGFKNFFRTCATDDMQGPGAARFAVGELGAKRIFIIDDMTTYGRGLAGEFEKKAVELGAQVLGHEGITQGDKDFAPLLTKIKALAPDLLYFAGMFPEGSLLIKQRAEVGMTARFMGGDGLFDPVLIDLATPQAAEGIYITTIGSDIHQMPTAQEFVRAYEERFGRIGAYSAYTYEAASIALWAIRKAGQRNRGAVLGMMKTFKDYPGVFGPQNFDERGDTLIHDIGIFTVKDGAFQFVKAATWD
jgi:branched-chain amino acid transport system substrate-binding protein